MNRSRIWTFRLIAFAIPILFFVLLELSLRLFGYGRDMSIFTTVPEAPAYQVIKPNVIANYFAEGAPVPSVTMEPNLFLKEKPLDGIRIFVLGGSTAAGFPYGLGASPAGLLDRRLKLTYPNHKVEVINAAMSAINSFSVLDFSQQLVTQKPDAVVIYMGHNEYLGILGAASNFSIAGSRATTLLMLKLKSLRLYQLTQNVYYSLFGPEPNAAQGKDLQARRTFMAQVAENKNIPFDSNIFKAGEQQFVENLAMILQVFQEHNIPVVISTLASNIADQPPFTSQPISDATRSAFNQLRKQLLQSDDSGEKNAVIRKMQKLANNNPAAQLYYVVAQAMESFGQFDQANDFYIQAKELDELRFRAPESFNTIIRNSAKQDGVYLVDYQQALSRSSPNGLIGEQFMLEHLHPNLQGYFILSDILYKSLVSNDILPTPKSIIDTQQAWRERPILPSEEYAAFAKIIQLKADYPFSETPKEVVLPNPVDWQQEIGLAYFKKEIDWLEMMNRNYLGYLKEGNVEMIMKTLKIIADALPNDLTANQRVAQYLEQQGKVEEAAFYYWRASLIQ